MSGLLVNWLADWLPSVDWLRGPDESDEIPAMTGVGHSSGVSGRVMAWLTHGAYNTPASVGRYRYLLVEILLIAAATSIWLRPGLPLHNWLLFIYIVLFVLISVIDIEHRLILNIVMIPAFVLALMDVAFGLRITLKDGLLGYAIAQIAVMGLYLLGGAYLAVVNARRDTPVTEVAFGFGDVTLATFCGLVVGSPGVIVMLVLMILLGGLVAGLYVIVRALGGKEYAAHTPLPYGPSIVLAAIVMMLYGASITQWILGT